MGSLYESGWADAQAETQFQGRGSSHELAALLLTEAIQYSLFNSKQPLFVIFLDAKSAFDKILRELVIRNAYLAGSQDQGLIYLDNRLKHRKTYVEWDKVLMGPICDRLGVEQGGCNSDRLYKLANNRELIITQQSSLGLKMGMTSVGSIGQADDVALISDDVHRLQCLLQLAMDYARDCHVEIVPEKTKLLCYSPRGFEDATYYWKVVSPIYMDGHSIKFSSEAEHVGVLRSPLPGNMSNVLARQSAHTRAVYGVLPAGLAKAHSGNPAAALRVERLYGAPVLLSGLAALVLNKTELASIHQHYKINLERLQRHYRATPSAVVFFMAGSLPATALLHLKQFSLLGMIARLGPAHILFKHGQHMLTAEQSNSHSWFAQVRELSGQYSLPDPLQTLLYPPSKAAMKRMTKLKILDWWQTLLRAKAASLDSLSRFHADFMSLSTPHPIWTSAGSSPFEVKKATVQARMLGGRYRTCWLVRHWSDTNGSCRIPGCSGDPGILPHIATGQCTGLTAAKIRAVGIWSNFLRENPHLFPIIQFFSLNDPEQFTSFLVDPTTKPNVISLAQANPGGDVVNKLCYMTRTWLFIMHKERLKLLGLWTN